MNKETASDVATASPPSKVIVWDLPTRLFHWSLVGLIAFSWWSAEEHLDELHIWSGIAVLTLLIFRLLWGVFGSSTARFANFVRGPKAVFGYLRGEWRGIGHTPLGALSVVALLALVSAEVGLGLIAGDEDGLTQGPLALLVNADTSETATELHDDLFDVLLVFIGLHVAAIVFYRLFRGKKLVAPMISGRADLGRGAEPMRPGKAWVSIICLLIALGVTRWVIAGAPPFGP